MNKRDRDRLILLAVTIAKLRDDLRIAEAEMDALIGRNGSDSTPTPSAATSVEPAKAAASESASPPKLSIVERIIGLLETTPGVLTASEVQKLLDIENAQTVRSTLARLATAERILSVGHGKYKAMPRKEDAQ